MEKIFLSYGWILTFVITAVELILCFGLLGRYVKSRKHAVVYMFLLALGLVYDAVIISIGRFMGAGDLLEKLSLVRFIVQAVALPQILPITPYVLELSDNAKRIMWIITLVLIGAGVFRATRLTLEVKETAGILRYVVSDTSLVWAGFIQKYTLPAMSAVLLICGLASIFKIRNFVLLPAGLFMAAVLAVTMFVYKGEFGFLMVMAAEILMLLFFYIYAGSLKRSY